MHDATASTAAVNRHRVYVIDAGNYHDVRDAADTYRQRASRTAATSVEPATTRKRTYDRYDLVHYSMLCYINAPIINVS